MAPEIKAKKRKGAEETELASKKPKSTKATKKSKAPKDEEHVAAKSTTKSGRKRAADFFDAEEIDAEGSKVDIKASTGASEKSKDEGKAEKKGKEKKTKSAEADQPKSKKQKVDTAFEDDSAVVKALEKVTKKEKKQKVDAADKATKATDKSKEKLAKKSKKGKISQPDEAELIEETNAAEEEEAAQAEEEDDDEEDDQTEALLKGFESSDEEDGSADEGFQPGQNVPALDKKAQKKLKAAEKKGANEDDTPGVVYVGRIPHGFYEHEMRAYFSQFGTITRLRLSRNRKTGRSKHYAFLEFASSGVARIVADTMNNYLMFGHILKCRVVPKEQVHEELFIGANKRFKAVPWNKLEGRKLKQPKTKEAWAQKIEKEKGKRANLKERLEAFGYDFEIPSLKGVDTIESSKQLEGKEEVKAMEDKPAEDTVVEQTLVESKTESNGVELDELVKTKKAKKAKKDKDVQQVKAGEKLEASKSKDAGAKNSKKAKK